MTQKIEGIAAVREVRKRISREHDNDPKRLVEYFMGLQERHADRLLGNVDQRGATAPIAPRRS